MHPVFIAALFTIAKTWGQPKCPSTDDFMTGILLSHKKNEILPFASTWMNLENTMLSEISQAEKDKYYMISLICGL